MYMISNKKNNCIFRSLVLISVEMWTIFTFTYLNGAMPQKMPFYFILLANKKPTK